jgi:hypothetical protein
MFQHFTTSVCIMSPLPPNEVQQRIHGASAGLMSFNSGLESLVRGSVQGDGCDLIASGGGRDLQKRVLRLSFLDQPNGGTLLRGEFALRPLAVGFAIAWFSFITLILFVGVVSRGGQNGASNEFILVPCALLAFGVLFALILSFVGRWHERAMIQFLEKLLEGKRGEC